MSNQDPESFAIVESLSEAQVPQVHALLSAQWWGTKRTLEDTAIMIQNSDLILAIVRQPSEQVIGFARVLTDFVFRGTIYDVAVDESMQGLGHGRRLLDAISEHRSLTKVSVLYLCCEPKMYAFYERWGFESYRPGSHRTQWMIKIQREE